MEPGVGRPEPHAVVGEDARVRRDKAEAWCEDQRKRYRGLFRTARWFYYPLLVLSIVLSAAAGVAVWPAEDKLIPSLLALGATTTTAILGALGLYDRLRHWHEIHDALDIESIRYHSRTGDYHGLTTDVAVDRYVGRVADLIRQHQDWLQQQKAPDARTGQQPGA